MQRIHIGPYFETMWGSSINLPFCTKYFCFLVFFVTVIDWCSSLFTKSDLGSSIFVLLPTSFIYRPWTLLTFPLREANPIVLAGTLLCVGANGKMFEPHWGRKEMAKFLALVNILSGLGFCFFFLFLFSFKKETGDLFQHVALGLGPTITAFSVCYKQAYPEYNVKIFGAFGFKLKQFPSILLAFLSILAFIFSIFQDYMVLCWFSAIISWVYLRFFKVQDLIRGDRSETFSFVSFFPTILRYSGFIASSK
ncbi:hypothetical protein DSO57_1035251 [Entomophthora muscae]|uniref:Uncharacterized protein n=1 Tax=Entomophthora muscae TaxID=34485 RepID=A0ACC2RQL2_9FUNG|nr:hypothetical protein DSO57_1035251 [Entomophthora muscae]